MALGVVVGCQRVWMSKYVDGQRIGMSGKCDVVALGIVAEWDDSVCGCRCTRKSEYQYL